MKKLFFFMKSEGQAVLGRQLIDSTPWLTERHGYDPTLPAGNYLLLCGKESFQVIKQ